MGRQRCFKDNKVIFNFLTYSINESLINMRAFLEFLREFKRRKQRLIVILNKRILNVILSLNDLLNPAELITKGYEKHISVIVLFHDSFNISCTSSSFILWLSLKRWSSNYGSINTFFYLSFKRMNGFYENVVTCFPYLSFCRSVINTLIGIVWIFLLFEKFKLSCLR